MLSTKMIVLIVAGLLVLGIALYFAFRPQTASASPPPAPRPAGAR